MSGFVPADGRSYDAERVTPADVQPLEDVIPVAPVVPPEESEVIPPAEPVTPVDPVVPPAPSEESEVVPPVDTPNE